MTSRWLWRGKRDLGNREAECSQRTTAYLKSLPAEGPPPLLPDLRVDLTRLLSQDDVTRTLPVGEQERGSVNRLPELHVGLRSAQ